MTDETTHPQDEAPTEEGVTVSATLIDSGDEISVEEGSPDSDSAELSGSRVENAATGDSAGTGASEDDQEDDGEEFVDEGEVAADYLEGLLDIADLDGDIDITVENDRAALSVVEVNAGDLEHLVGDDGRVLSALQDLTRLAVTRETGQRSRLMLDIAGHRATRRAELQRIARQAISEAKETGQPVRMASMTAFERKVVHDEVAAEGLSSESEGSEPQRYVVITPA